MKLIRTTIHLALVLALVPAALAAPKTNPELPANSQQKPCVILKRMGPADQITSHFYAWGLRGKQYQFVEGRLPDGVKFHGRLTDNDVRKIRKAGAPVEILESHYTDVELQQARQMCGIPTSAVPAAAAVAAFVTVKSIPSGADISVDGNYSGSTPSKISLATGEHKIAVKESGYAVWQRTITVKPGDDINMNATLSQNKN